MIKIVNEINTLAGSLFPIKEKYKSFKQKIKSNFFINIYGNLESAKYTMICLHGAGGTRFSNHVINFCNTFINEFNENDACFVTFDMPGIGENVYTEKFWGSQKKSIDVNLDDIIDFIYKKNKKTNFFISAISASSIQLLAYMTDKSNVVKNKFKNKVKHFYFISPSGETDETLDWVILYSKYKKFISFHHAISQFNFLIKNSKYKNLKGIQDCFFDIKKSNYFLDQEKYEFNFDSKFKNCDAILSRHDSITNYDIAINFLNRFNKINIVEYNLGGHVGFFSFNIKKRKHELYIINSIKKQC